MYIYLLSKIRDIEIDAQFLWKFSCILSTEIVTQQMIKKMLSVGIGVEEIFKHMVVDEYYWDQNTINLFRHVHPFSRIPILPVYKLQANGVFFLTMLLCQIFSNVFSQWHMYGIGVVLLVALNDLVGSEAPTILRNFLQRFKSTKEE